MCYLQFLIIILVLFISINLAKYKDAITFYKKTLDIDIEIFGQNSLSVGITYNNLAKVFESQAKYEISLEYSKKKL